MNLKPLILAGACLALSLATSSPGSATVLFQDNFETDFTDSMLPAPNLNNWTISNGSVDYLLNITGIDCFNGSSGCLDMDGDSFDAGRITSKTLFTFVAGLTYTLSAEISGNQRLPPSDSLDFGIDTLSGSVISVTSDSSDPFSLRSTTFTTASTFTGRLFFEASGGDNIGQILDNVTLSDDQTQTVVPQPGTLLLIGLGLWALAIGRRRREM